MSRLLYIYILVIVQILFTTADYPRQRNVKLDQLATLIRPHALQETSSDTNSDSDSDDSSDDVDDPNAAIRKLRFDRIINAIKKIAEGKNNQLKGNHRYVESNDDLYSDNDRFPFRVKPTFDKLNKPGIIKNNILKNYIKSDTYAAENYLRAYLKGNPEGLQDYSKIFLILNTKDLNKSKNRQQLGQLISRIVDLTSPSKLGPRKKRPNLDNRFKRNLLSRRSRGEPKNSEDSSTVSIDDDSRPRRNPLRSFGAHTAIPFVGNKEDIFESS